MKAIVITGVGGTGVITAGKLLQVILEFNNFNTIRTETHGLAQRSGSVNSIIKFSKNKIYSFSNTTTDIIVGFEIAETVRTIKNYAKKDTYVLSTTLKINPSIDLISFRNILENFNHNIIDFEKIIKFKFFNTILIGVLCKYLNLNIPDIAYLKQSNIKYADKNFELLKIGFNLN